MTVTLSLERGSLPSLKAIFAPEKGMDLLSFKIGDLEMVGESPAKGLIGPRFRKRYPGILPQLPEGLNIPQLTKHQGDPFPNGIARYVPWQYEMAGNTLKARLSSKSEWNGVPLNRLEGQSFEMQMNAHLDMQGLHLFISVVSDTDSLVGIEYFWNLLSSAKIEAQVKPEESIPHAWLKEHVKLSVPLETSINHTFHPFESPLGGFIDLSTSKYHLRTRYMSESQENSWHATHQEGAPSVAISPISSQDPKRPNLSASWLKIILEPSLFQEPS